MAIKIEWVLIVLVISIGGLSYQFKITQQTKHKSKKTKDLEFYDTTFRKVDTKELISKIDTTYGVLESKVLRLRDINYQDKLISKLLANKATKYDDVMYLEDNVSLWQVDGFEYHTQKAIYNKKQQTLVSPNKFNAKKEQDWIDGNHLIYHLDKKVATASSVHAIIEMSKKSKE